MRKNHIFFFLESLVTWNGASSSSWVLSHLLFTGQRWTNQQNSKEKEGYTWKLVLTYTKYIRVDLHEGPSEELQYLSMALQQRQWCFPSIKTITWGVNLFCGFLPLWCLGPNLSCVCIFLMINSINKVHSQFSLLCTIFRVSEVIWSLGAFNFEDSHRKSIWVFLKLNNFWIEAQELNESDFYFPLVKLVTSSL